MWTSNSMGSSTSESCVLTRQAVWLIPLILNTWTRTQWRTEKRQVQSLHKTLTFMKLQLPSTARHDLPEECQPEGIWIEMLACLACCLTIFLILVWLPSLNTWGIKLVSTSACKLWRDCYIPIRWKPWVPHIRLADPAKCYSKGFRTYHDSLQHSFNWNSSLFICKATLSLMAIQSAWISSNIQGRNIPRPFRVPSVESQRRHRSVIALVTFPFLSLISRILYYSL